MKTLRFVLFMLLAGFIFGCGTGGTESGSLTPQKIATLEAKLFGQEEDYNAKDALELMHLYVLYSDSLPSDSLAPIYLFKAADISMFQQEGGQTIAILDRILVKYPQHELAAMSLFLKAFTFDTRLNDTASARVYYQQFVNKYPDEEFTDDAINALKNLGKTPEELVREFELMNE